MSRLYKRNRDLSQPIERLELRVDKPDEGRFDRFLAGKLRWRSREGVKELIEGGAARLNGQQRKPSTKLRAGDAVVVDVPRAEPDENPRAPAIRILHEDEELMVLDKESGVVVHPVGAHQYGTLLQALHERADAGTSMLPKLIHRLDQHTSGVLLVAKNDPVRVAFSEMLERGEMRKEYDALLLGRLAPDEQEVDAPIGPIADSRILMGVDREHGKTARSTFTVVRRLEHATHARVRIETGRTHQIRVHAAHLGHPLLGDHLYGDGLPVGKYAQFALHARSVRFLHPRTGEAMTVEAPLPERFVHALQQLE